MKKKTHNLEPFNFQIIRGETKRVPNAIKGDRTLISSILSSLQSVCTEIKTVLNNTNY